jgi:hypothetical protein
MVGPSQKECHSSLVIFFPRILGDQAPVVESRSIFSFCGFRVPFGDWKRNERDEHALGSRPRCSAPLCRRLGTGTADVSPFSSIFRLAHDVCVISEASRHEIIFASIKVASSVQGSCLMRNRTYPDGEAWVFPARTGLEQMEAGLSVSAVVQVAAFVRQAVAPAIWASLAVCIEATVGGPIPCSMSVPCLLCMNSKKTGPVLCRRGGEIHQTEIPEVSSQPASSLPQLSAKSQTETRCLPRALTERESHRSRLTVKY